MKEKYLFEKDNKDYVLSRISFNIKAEAEANEFYFELLRLVSEEDKDIIKGIIADELNHAIILGRLQEKYSKILPSEFYPLNSLKKREK